MTRPIFVFGSNLAGRHGKGAALAALHHHGAIYGVGEGMQGESYAIPTKDRYLNTLPLTHIWLSVTAFNIFAAENPELTFEVTKIGCGLAGYTEEEIAPMFCGAPKNCILPPGWGCKICAGLCRYTCSKCPRHCNPQNHAGWQPS